MQPFFGNHQVFPPLLKVAFLPPIHGLFDPLDSLSYMQFGISTGLARNVARNELERLRSQCQPPTPTLGLRLDYVCLSKAREFVI